jgi:predicted DNA-binding protein (MmcQ/YjbR family)
MGIDDIIRHGLALPGAEESMPFGEETLVFKVGGKIFLLLSLDKFPPTFNVKCEPGLALDLRERYSFVRPGYHMNKKHWNTVTCDEGTPDLLLKQWIDHSYALVAESLPAKSRPKSKTLPKSKTARKKG